MNKRSTADVEVSDRPPAGKPTARALLSHAVPHVNLVGLTELSHRTGLYKSTVPYSREVVDFFRATGDGWQSRMDGALKEYIAQHPKAPIS